MPHNTLNCYQVLSKLLYREYKGKNGNIPNNSDVFKILQSYFDYENHNLTINGQEFVKFLNNISNSFLSYLNADSLGEFLTPHATPHNEYPGTSNEDRLLKSLEDMIELNYDRDKNNFPRLPESQYYIVSKAMELIEDIKRTAP